MLMLSVVYFLVLEVNHDVVSHEHFETIPEGNVMKMREREEGLYLKNSFA